MDLTDLLTELPAARADYCADINAALYGSVYRAIKDRGVIYISAADWCAYMPSICTIGKNYPAEARCKTATDCKYGLAGVVYLVRSRADWQHILNYLLEEN